MKTGESWTELGLGSFVQFQWGSAVQGYQVCLVEGHWVMKVEVAYESYVLVWHTGYAKPVLQKFCPCDTLTQERKSHHAQITHLQFQIRIKQHTPGLKLSTLSFKDLLLKTYFFLTYRTGSKCLFVAFTVLRCPVPFTCPKLYFLLLCSFRIPICSGLYTG